jgi:hypothetical protein
MRNVPRNPCKRAGVAAAWLLLLAGVCASCTRASGSAARQQPASDYAVYAAVLRAHFMAPPADADGDGEPQACELTEPVKRLNIVHDTKLRLMRGRAQDSALAAELSPRTAPLLATLFALSARPARTLVADSFALGVPVTLVATTQDGKGMHSPITLSRVAYSADAADAVVLAVQPCNGARELMPELEDESGQGTSVLVALHRQNGAWVIQKVVYLDVD